MNSLVSKSVNEIEEIIRHFEHKYGGIDVAIEAAKVVAINRLAAAEENRR